jgi:hypothetical protein
MRACADCGEERARIRRGLCVPCYQRHHRAGTLADWPRSYADHDRTALPRALLAEQFAPPVAEYQRPLLESFGDGGEDTPERVAKRLRVLNGTNEEEETA